MCTVPEIKGKDGRNMEDSAIHNPLNQFLKMLWTKQPRQKCNALKDFFFFF